MGPLGVDLGMSRHQTKGYPFTNPVKILMLDGLARLGSSPKRIILYPFKCFDTKDYPLTLRMVLSDCD